MDKHLCIGGPNDGGYVLCGSDFFICPPKPHKCEIAGDGTSDIKKDTCYRKTLLADGPNNTGDEPKYFHVFIAQDGDERGVIERLIAGYRAGE